MMTTENNWVICDKNHYVKDPNFLNVYNLLVCEYMCVSVCDTKGNFH